VEGYGGAVLTEAGDVNALIASIREAKSLVGGTFSHPRTWDDTLGAYNDLFGRVLSQDPRSS
jgi:hypothetical protein